MTDKILSKVKIKSSQKVCGGDLKYCSHISKINNCLMNFAIFIPGQAHLTQLDTPYLLFLSGLTCTEDNFIVKSGAFKKAAELGLALLVCDTSPRGENVADDAAYDLGQGAGFYIDAIQKPWVNNFQMESYLIKELLPLAEKTFGLAYNRKSISGHSMGGHGALTLYYKYPDKFISCSAFAPIVAPSQTPWGKKAFLAYIGKNEQEWKNHDACQLVRRASSDILEKEILIDQGLADNFLEEQLKPDLFEVACKEVGQELTLHRRKGYDHSYFFIQTFIDSHMEFHFKKILQTNLKD